MVNKGKIVTIAFGAVLLAASGYSVYNKYFGGDGQKQEESKGTASATLPDDIFDTDQKSIVESVFDQYQASKYFSNSLSIPKGKPKNIAALVNQCTDGAAFYHGSTGGTSENFPRGLVEEVCHHSITDELDFSGCSAKKGGALYCNGHKVHKKDLFVLKYR